MQKKRLPIMLIVLFLVLALPVQGTMAVSSETVDTDKPIYQYLGVGGDVVISGSGYDASKMYYIEIIYPGGYQWVSYFTAVTDFEYIHPLASPYPAGTYIVNIYDTNTWVLVANCQFGVWGIENIQVFNRGEEIIIVGGGVCIGSTVAIDIFFDEDGDLGTTGDQTQMDVAGNWGEITNPTANGYGEFTSVVSIPSDALVSVLDDAVYFVKITYNSYDGCGASETGLTDTQTFEVSATYTVIISDLPTEVMNRGEDVTFLVNVTDASGDPVTGATISFNDPKGGTVASGITDNGDGSYSVTYTIADDDPVGTWTITATATKDGNSGSSPGEDTVEISATYTITWYDPKAPVLINKGHTQDFYFLVTDASGDPVDTITTLFLDIDGDLTSTDDQDSIGIENVDPGEYEGSWTPLCYLPVGDYDCIVTKAGNRGETPDYVTVSELILVDAFTSKSTYGGLEQLVIYAFIYFEDGAIYTDSDGMATAYAWVDADGDGEIDAGEFALPVLSLEYDSDMGYWYRSEYFYTPGAIYGTYTLLVIASDECNFGEDVDTFMVTPQTMKADNIGDDLEGPVGGEVDIWGSGFVPDMDVDILWEMFIEEDFVGIGDGKTVDFSLVLPGMAYVFGGDIYLDGEPASGYTIDPWTGVVTFSTPPAYGVVITADYGPYILLTTTTTDEYGSFSTSFVVPESYAGLHWVYAIQWEGVMFADPYHVEPQIVLSSTKGPPEAWITVTGTGFAPNSEVYIDAVLPYYFVEVSWAVAKTDAYGTFAEAIMLPMKNLYFNLVDLFWEEGEPPVAPIVIEAWDGDENFDVTFYLAFLWCQEDTIDVDVEVGELYFPGEVITVYALTSVDGVPTDVENIEFFVYHETLGPRAVSQFLPIVHVDTGLYAMTSTLPGDVEPGNYLFEVKASKATYYLIEDISVFYWWMMWADIFYDFGEYWGLAWEELGYEYMYMEGYEATINGVGIEGFVVSPTLMGMDAWIKDIKGEIAEIVIPGIETIQVTLDAIRAKELAVLLSNTAEILDNQEALADLMGDVYRELELTHEDLAELMAFVYEDLEYKIDDLSQLVVDVYEELSDELYWTYVDLADLIDDVADKLQLEHEALADLIGEVFDALDIKLDDINAEIVALKGKIDGYYLSINTTLGELELKLDETVIPFLMDIEAKLDFILDEEVGPLFQIYTAIGDIEMHMDEAALQLLESINASLVSINEDVEGYYLSLNTVLGELELKLDYIDATVVSIDGKAAEILLRIGTPDSTVFSELATLKGKIVALEGDVATIETDVGEIVVVLPPLKESVEAGFNATSMYMPIETILSAFALIAAIAACLLITRKVV